MNLNPLLALGAIVTILLTAVILAALPGPGFVVAFWAWVGTLAVLYGVRR